MINDLNSIVAHAVQAAVKEALAEFSNQITQHRPVYLREFLPLKEIEKKYNFSARTLYNYHCRGIIRLRSVGEGQGKTFVSVIELERIIRQNVIKSKYNLTTNPDKI